MSTLKLSYNENNAYEILQSIEARESEKNDFQLMPLYGRASYLSKKYRIEIFKRIDDSNYKIYFYNKANKLAKKLEVIDNVVYDPDYQDEGIRKEVDMYNSAWLRAFIIQQEEKGIPVTNWKIISKYCKIKMFMKIELTEDGTQTTKLLYFCKTKIDGKWKWTGNKVEYKRRKPKEKCKIARYLFGEKGVSTKAIMFMLGYRDVTQVNRCVKDLRQGMNECKL